MHFLLYKTRTSAHGLSKETKDQGEISAKASLKIIFAIIINISWGLVPYLFLIFLKSPLPFKLSSLPFHLFSLFLPFFSLSAFSISFLTIYSVVF